MASSYFRAANNLFPWFFRSTALIFFLVLFLNETKWSILYNVSQLIFVALDSCFLHRFHVANVREELLCQIDVWLRMKLGRFFTILCDSSGKCPSAVLWHCFVNEDWTEKIISLLFLWVCHQDGDSHAEQGRSNCWTDHKTILCLQFLP